MDSEVLPTLTRTKLREIVSSAVPGEKIDFEAETLMIQVIEEFLDDVIKEGCKNAKHRGSQTLEAPDMTLYLERYHEILACGFQNIENSAIKRIPANATGGTDEHAKRLFHAQRAAITQPQPNVQSLNAAFRR